MADYCKQCSLAIFGEDFGDLKWTPEPGEVDFFMTALCEGCGPIQVKSDGTCVSVDCLEKGHAKREGRSGDLNPEVPTAG